MKLRARLIVTVLLVSVPAVVALALLDQSLRRKALLESVYESNVARMESGGRELCESAPRRFASGGGGRAQRGVRGRAVGRRARLARSPRVSRERRIYDDAYQPLLPVFGPLEPALARELDAGEPIAAEWIGEERVRIAMRMPWDGPCAVVVVERGAGPLADPGSEMRAIAWSLVVAVVTALTALLAMGPLVRRMRRLTSAVRAQARGGYASDVEVRGTDEVADLARAFNDASHEIRRKLAELSSRDRALTEFLESTTHDVMVPLTVLQGHLSDLSGATRRGGAADPRKISAALEEAHYLGALLRNLSAAARLSGGEPMLARHSFDLRAVVERVIARHAPIARERRVELAHAVPETPVEVVADSTLVEQAISNLVHNALRYNHEGGHVAVVLEEERGGARFELRVVDDGPGIPPEDLARVSERRFRGGEARKRAPGGLGLGLHIVRDVAQRHGWSLRFDAPDAAGREEGARGLVVTLAGSTGEPRPAHEPTT